MISLLSDLNKPPDITSHIYLIALK